MARWRFARPSIFVLILATTASSFVDECYYPDGSAPADYSFVACNNSAVSACCVPSEGDICLANGLCQDVSDGSVFRGACTDQTWKSSSCPQICVKGYESDWTYATQCASGAFVCGGDYCPGDNSTTSAPTSLPAKNSTTTKQHTSAFVIALATVMSTMVAVLAGLIILCVMRKKQKRRRAMTMARHIKHMVPVQKDVSSLNSTLSEVEAKPTPPPAYAFELHEQHFVAEMEAVPARPARVREVPGGRI